ncbi:cation diffusion facilitator family transporter [Marinobacterium aestuariivivens]|uniref:Cation diffusion facilitator family transporter n=1 Tax=Marinobacterium aestuariivivens TaxID=1698799 RepID=A0ABW2A615_9GAMM
MASSHGHAHGHEHHQGPADYNRAFAIGVGLNSLFVLIEAVYGLAADSLALLADAGHNLSDVLGLLLAWGASYLARQQMTHKRTFGLKKSTILAALINAIVLLIAIGGIAWEAVRRFDEPAPVAGMTVIVVAAIGIAVNTATMLLFMTDRRRDLNIQGAFLHMAADAAVSLGVVIAGVAMLYTGAYWIDPVVSLVIAAVIMISTWSLLKDSLNLAVDAVPEGIDALAVKQALGELPGVAAVHDLHIWGLSTTETALMAHLVRPDGDDHDKLIRAASEMLHQRFDIDHATLQVERSLQQCPSGARC